MGAGRSCSTTEWIILLYPQKGREGTERYTKPRIACLTFHEAGEVRSLGGGPAILSSRSSRVFVQLRQQPYYTCTPSLTLYELRRPLHSPACPSLEPNCLEVAPISFTPSSPDTLPPLYQQQKAPSPLPSPQPPLQTPLLRRKHLARTRPLLQNFRSDVKRC